jgi:hypothetical protein
VSKSAEEIAVLFEDRKNAMGEDIDRMRHIQAVMNNEIVLPIAELTEEQKPAVANLASQGMNQLARRIASVTSMHHFPSLDPAKKKANDLARNKGRVMTGWHAENKLRLKTAKRARQFLAYATSPVIIKPDSKSGIPRWYHRDPLHTFPAEAEFEDCRPMDCIFATRHTYKWLHAHYPEQAMTIAKPHSWDPTDPDWDLQFDVLEYVDPEVCSMVVVGHNSDPVSQNYPISEGAEALTLVEVPNLTGQCLAVVPGAINLDKQLGHFDNIIGMYQAQAALMAITLVAQRRAVWPREWAISNPNENVNIVSIPDPPRGQPGKLTGGKIETQVLDPSMKSLEVMDRLEYAERMTAGLPSEFGGASPTNVRTGRRGAQVMGAAVDFTISEAQDVFADSQCEENKVAIAVDKAYFNRKKTYYITTRSFSGTVDYKPSELWTVDKHVVEYPMAGVDLQNLPIEGGQRVMMKSMSRKRFMEIDPVIPDADAEERRVIAEGIQDAFVTSIQTLASNPEGPYQPPDLASLYRHVMGDMELFEAVETVQREAQERQAKMAEAQGPEAGMAAGMAPPEAQPGMSLPGQGVEQPTGPPVDDTSLQNMTNLLGQLGTVQTAQKHRK